MFFTYLKRELGKRRKQTALVAGGLAVAIAVVLVVAGMASGIRQAQSEALSGLYGIGTDITVSKAESFSPGQFGQRFNFGANGGRASGGSTQTFNRTRLQVQRGSATLTAAQVANVVATKGVQSATATLKLSDTTFNGTLPTFSQNPQAGSGATGPGGGLQFSRGSGGLKGGFDGQGGSSFNITSFTVEGVSTDSNPSVGPLAGVKITSGRGFQLSDASSDVTLVDASYAKSSGIKLGSTISIDTRDLRVVGIVQSSGPVATTPSNIYVPIAVAQAASGNAGAFTTVYVKATSSSVIDSTKAALVKSLGKSVTVSTESDLASNVTGSLATASGLVVQLGGWLAVVVLLAAFATSVLFTTSGVNRRVREFGTLKAIGWRSNRIVWQVLGESLVTGLLGGVMGLILGLGAVTAINLYGPSVNASVSRGGFFGGMGGPFGGGGGFGGGFGGGNGAGGGFRRLFGETSNTMNLSLHANIEPWMIIAAVGFAILGGVLAGAFGGLRAAKLSPSQAFRSVD